MDISQIVIIVIATSLVTSFFMLILTYFFFQSYLKQKIKKESEEIGQLLKERLRQGVWQAGKDILPEFRQEVREGFTEALSRAISGEIIPQAARQIAKNSQGLVEQGLSFLLGRSQETEESSPSSKQEK